MNTKTIIGALVAAILFFLWQFLSWSMLNIHGPQQKYHPKQTEILACLSQNITEDGSYLLPNLPPNTPMDEYKKFHNETAGKPWAEISYHKASNTNMSMNMIRGFVVDFLCMILLIWLLLKDSNRTFYSTLTTSLAIGILSYLTTSYTNSIWFQNNSIPDLIDAFVSWGLVGAWFGWWLNKK